MTDTVRDVQNAVKDGRVTPAVRTKFQAVALILREERARVRTSGASEGRRNEQLKRLDGIATTLAVAAVRDADLLALLEEDAVVSSAAMTYKRDLLSAAGVAPEPEPEEEPEDVAATPVAPPERRAVPQSVISRQLANPFLAPDFSAVAAAPQRSTRPRRLGRWDLVPALLSSFERATGGEVACMPLPPPSSAHTPRGLELMQHQGQVVAAAEEGHRTFLLADEPGLGKTAQALLAAEAAAAYPLLVVVPSVVKTNWAREAGLWTPHRAATVIQGSGENINGFADVVIVNYEVLDRHMGWLGGFGFRGMVVDEAHFIKNTTSQRSQNVLEIADRIRSRTVRPLMMALTGTPLINDVDDFRAIWRFLGWIDADRPLPPLVDELEDADLTPADPEFYPNARRTVIDLGIVRRRKVDVAADIPARRVADLPVDLDGAEGRSIRAAEAALAARMVERYERAMAHRAASGIPVRAPAEPDDAEGGPLDVAQDPADGTGGGVEAVDVEGLAAAEGLDVAVAEVAAVDHDLVRRVAKAELKDSATDTGENVFSVVRRIGRAKAGLAADYAAQLARSAGKVVFFAKHVDVMDAVEESFTRQGVRFASVRGGQTPGARQQQVDAFVNDPEVAVAVCSLTAAGVGLNLQVASNVVLAELSWTDAEQTQAIDRAHRIGQTEPVTAWRIIAAQTVDARIAKLIDSKAGLAARALDGSDEEVSASTDVQLEVLVALLTDALRG